MTHFYTQDPMEAQAAVANMGATSEGNAFWAIAGNPSNFFPMYQASVPKKDSQILTTFIDERDAVVNEEGYTGMGIAFWCLLPVDPVPAGSQPLFRRYNAELQDHLYTINDNEMAAGYKREGTASLVFTELGAGMAPLLRFLNLNTKRHYYSIKDDAPQGYIFEFVCGFVTTTDSGAPLPLYRSYHPTTGGHLYTTDIAEHDNASINYGYRGDGIACYIFRDAFQAANTTELFRASNATIDDHFYTIDQGEFNNAIMNLNYVGETSPGFVFSQSSGTPKGDAGFTQAMQRFVGNFADDFFLLPANLPQSLTGNNNFIITSEVGAGIDAIVGLEVELTVTEDITVVNTGGVNNGLSLQLNGFSPDGFASAWQQYVIFLDGKNFTCELQNWSDNNPYAVGFIVETGHLCKHKGFTLPKGYKLRIKLSSDEYDNITGADFYIYNGNTQLGHSRQLVKNAPNGVDFGAAPIIAFQLLLVSGQDTTTFAPGGVGFYTFKADVPLVAGTTLPANAEDQGPGTFEQSNIVYGEMASTKSKNLTQTLSS